MAKPMYVVRRVAITTDEGVRTCEYAVVRVDNGELTQVGNSYVDISDACDAAELLIANDKIADDTSKTFTVEQGLKSFLIGMGVVGVAIIAGTLLGKTIVFVSKIDFF